MNTLQFIDTMTGRLAWPVAAVLLGLVFHRSLSQLLDRVRKLRWREAEAELERLAEATEDVREAAKEAVKSLPADAEGGSDESRARIERLMEDSAVWGAAAAAVGSLSGRPIRLGIEWIDGEPRIASPDIGSTHGGRRPNVRNELRRQAEKRRANQSL